MRRVVKAINSTKVRLGSLAVMDLLWRVPAATPGDGSVADVVIAAVALVIGEVTILRSVTTWMLIGYAAYALTPKAYPGVSFPREERGFRFLFASATATMVFVLPVEISGTALPPRLLFQFFVWIIIFAGLFILYLYYRGWQMQPDFDPMIEVFDRIIPATKKKVRQELHRDLTAPGWRGKVGRAIGWSLLGGISIAPCFLAGLVATSLLISSPFGELLFLFAVVTSAVRQRISLGTNRSPPEVFDLETYLYNSISHSLRTSHGVWLLLCELYLLFLSLGGLALSLQFWPSIIGGVADLLFNNRGSLAGRTELYLILSAGVGAITLTVTGCAYATWAGIREIPRIAAFVDIKQDQQPRPTPSRPVGFVLPGLSMMLLFWFVISSVTEPPILIVPFEIKLFAVGWPLLFGGLVWCWWLTHRRGEMPVTNEYHVVVGTTALITGVLVFIIYEAALGSALMWTVMTLGLGYNVYANKYAIRHLDHRLLQHTHYVYIILLGVVLFAGSHIFDSVGAEYTQLFGVGAIIGGIIGISLGLIETTVDNDLTNENQNNG